MYYWDIFWYRGAAHSSTDLELATQRGAEQHGCHGAVTDIAEWDRARHSVTEQKQASQSVTEQDRAGQAALCRIRSE